MSDDEPTITEEEAAEGARYALRRLAEAEPVTDDAEDAAALTADGGTFGAGEWGPEDVTPDDVLTDPHSDRTLTIQTVDLKERSYGDDRLYVDAEKENGQTVTLRRWHLENAAASMTLKRPETDGGTSWDAGRLTADRAEQRDAEAVEAAMRRLTHADHLLADEATQSDVEAALRTDGGDEAERCVRCDTSPETAPGPVTVGHFPTEVVATWFPELDLPRRGGDVPLCDGCHALGEYDADE